MPGRPAVGASGSRPAELAISFFDFQLWPFIFLQPLDLKECTVPHLKDLIHICLELKAKVMA